MLTHNPSSVPAIADRLRISRLALGYRQTEISHILHSEPSLWANYENQSRRISLDKALQLKTVTGLTLDWIYCGDLSGLPTPLATKIIEQMKRERVS
jgi:transcriptional regulator with XRE-family HTH domain